VTPTKLGWSFEPPSYEYGSVTQDQVKVNFKPQRITSKITGNVGLPQVTLMGFPTSVVSGANGEYSADVDFNWKGIVIPRKDGFTFEPASREYNDVQMSQANQDYQHLIMRHSIAGRVADETGAPVADVIVAAEGEPRRPPARRQIDLVAPLAGRVTFRGRAHPESATSRFSRLRGPEVNVAKIKMMTITDRIAITQEPSTGHRGREVRHSSGHQAVVTTPTASTLSRVPTDGAGPGVLQGGPCSIPIRSRSNVTDIDNINPRPARPPEVTPPCR
jgi:hypothetical protein